MRSFYPGRKVSVIPTKLQFTILDSARDMVAGSQKGKCELKYVMHSPAKVVECCGENLETSTVFVHSIKYAGLIRIFCLG